SNSMHLGLFSAESPLIKSVPTCHFNPCQAGHFEIHMSGLGRFQGFISQPVCFKKVSSKLQPLITLRRLSESLVLIFLIFSSLICHIPFGLIIDRWWQMLPGL
uniref:Uncharacterized protein n=1 Tax=Oryzias latipes TaxID=8090 RepID=A0A3B3I7K9_ORYLA